MIVLAAALAGALFGAWRARSRKGRLADVLQYAAVHAMAFALAGLFAALFIERVLL